MEFVGHFGEHAHGGRCGRELLGELQLGYRLCVAVEGWGMHRRMMDTFDQVQEA
jgi:hypothetical protein